MKNKTQQPVKGGRLFFKKEIGELNPLNNFLEPLPRVETPLKILCPLLSIELSMNQQNIILSITTCNTF